MNTKILIIDNDEELNKLLTIFLQKLGYHVVSSIEPALGIEIAFKDSPDVIILDIMMPDMDGFEVCRRIRTKANIPIIMLTARGDVTDRIVGLEIGADDYMSKPFEPRELDARIRTILRRSRNVVAQEQYEFKNLIIYPGKYVALLNGNEIDLSSLEFDLLMLFVKNKGRVLSRDAILENLKGNDWSNYDRSTDMLVSRLRQKLNDDPYNPEFIRTIRSTGYIFIGE